MTIQESTVCSLIQSFPILLILAQNHNKCLKTPLIYKPPSPTHSPEYYEALDALFHSLYGHGYQPHHDLNHGCDHSYGKTWPIGSPCHSNPSEHGHQVHSYGYPYGLGHTGPHEHYYPAISYPGSSGHYPNSYGLRKGSLYNTTGYKGSYAPNQVYNVNHKYKVVIKKNKRKSRPHKRRPIKLQHLKQDNDGFPSFNREDRRYGNQFTQNNFQIPRRIPSRVTNIIHLQPEGPSYNPQYVYPFSRPENNYQQQYYSNQPPYQTYEGQRPYQQNDPYYGSNNYPNRPQWNYNQQNTGGRDPVIVVVEEVTESPKSSEIKQDNSFEDRYSDLTTKAPEVFRVPGVEVGNEANGGSVPGIPNQTPVSISNNQPPFSSQSGGLQPLEPAGTQPPSSQFGGLQPLAPAGTFPAFSSQSGALQPLEPAGTQPPFSSQSSDLQPLAPAGTVPPFAPPSGGLAPLAPAGTLPPLTAGPDTANRGGFNYATQGIFQESCDTPDGGVGSCVSLMQCDPYLSQLKMARSNPDIVVKLRKAHCGFEGDNPKVCCPRRGIPTNTPAPVVTEAPKELEPEKKGNEPNPEEQEESPPEVADEDQYVAALPDPPVCGSSNASFSRVVGGIPAKLGDFPWMALLGYRSARLRDKVSFLCGGSIITEKHILTAAHCYHTQRNKLTLVRLGELDLARTDEGATPIDINIKRVIEHENYDANAYLNDIAVLLLEQLIPFTDLIKPICLPKTTELRSLTFEKYTPLIAGWGELQWHGEQASLLQVVQLPVTSNEYCKKAFASYKAQCIDDRVLCAGYEKGNKDACRGDSGGPLMQPIWNNVNYTTYFYQIGVVSFGKKCAEPGFPGVYSRVTTFMPWIEKAVLGHTL